MDLETQNPLALAGLIEKMLQQGKVSGGSIDILTRGNEGSFRLSLRELNMLALAEVHSEKGAEYFKGNILPMLSRKAAAALDTLEDKGLLSSYSLTPFARDAIYLARIGLKDEIYSGI